MFSGGRDSTVAAARLAESFSRLTLLTICSGHLVGIEQVHRRIEALSPLLTKETEWYKIVQPKLPVTEMLSGRTCLPCQRAYVITGAIIAQRSGAEHLAMGYSGYQNTWPEQTPYAVARLTKLLESFGITLILPVYDITSKGAVMEELSGLGLSNESQEQKCLRQHLHMELEEEALREEIDRWIEGIGESLRRKDEIEMTILHHVNIR